MWTISCNRNNLFCIRYNVLFAIAVENGLIQLDDGVTEATDVFWSGKNLRGRRSRCDERGNGDQPPVENERPERRRHDHH